jgi:hypothetical protein
MRLSNLTFSNWIVTHLAHSKQYVYVKYTQELCTAYIAESNF